MPRSKPKTKEKILTQAEIAKIYGVSRPTTGKWVEDAQQERNLIQLINISGVYYALDNPHNHQVFTSLRDKSLKYRNRIEYYKTSPKDSLYEVFAQKQLVKLVSSLEKGVISGEFLFHGEGAEIWQKFLNSSSKKSIESFSNFDISTYLDPLIPHLEKVNSLNLFDVGNTNIECTKKVIQYFLDKKIDIRYFFVGYGEEFFQDIEMQLVQTSPQVSCQYIDFEDLESALFLAKNEHLNRNIICDFNYLASFKDEICTSKEIMTGNDLYLCKKKLNLPGDSEFVDFLDNYYFEKLYALFFEMLGIDKYSYSVETRISPDDSEFLKVLRFEKDIDLVFELDGLVKTVSLISGQEVIFYKIKRYRAKEAISIFLESGLTIKNISTTVNMDGMYFVVGV